MYRFWIEQIAAIEFAAIALIGITLGVTIAAWVMIRRRSKG